MKFRGANCQRKEEMLMADPGLLEAALCRAQIKDRIAAFGSKVL